VNVARPQPEKSRWRCAERNTSAPEGRIRARTGGGDISRDRGSADDGSELDADLAGEDPYGDASDPRAFTRSVLRDGLAPALRSDQVVLRAFVRNLNLLSPPDALLTDADFSARVFAVLQTKDQRPPEPSLGPATRADFLDSLTVA
jgi:hypothetical protein